MRTWIYAFALAGTLVATRSAASAGVEAGDAAPEFEGKEFVNTEPCSFKSLRGHAVLVEIFRTW